MNANASKAGTVYIVRRSAHAALTVRIVRTSAIVTTTVRAIRRRPSARALVAGKGLSVICRASRASMASGAERSVRKDIPMITCRATT